MEQSGRKQIKPQAQNASILWAQTGNNDVSTDCKECDCAEQGEMEKTVSYR